MSEWIITNRSHMKLREIYEIAVKRGMHRDPRKPAEIKDSLDKARKEYRKLKGVDKKAFDTESLTNPSEIPHCCRAVADIEAWLIKAGYSANEATPPNDSASANN